MASTYLSRTPSAGNRRTWTYSTWIKRSRISNTAYHFGISAVNSGTGARTEMQFNGDPSNPDEIVFGVNSTGSAWNEIFTNAKFRDVNGWYHIVIAFDTTQATSSNRVKIYVNGEQVTFFRSASYPSLNEEAPINDAIVHEIGRYASSATNYFDGSISHTHFIDGTAYDADTFGETDSTTGIWKPKTAPSVTYGTNGFFLKFENSGAFGTDSSGNANNFTVNGTMTQTIDTPSNVFATLNPLATNTNTSNSDYTNGNLTLTRAVAGWVGGTCTLPVSSGKYYAEYKVIDTGNPNNGVMIGVTNVDLSNFQNGGNDLEQVGEYGINYYANGVILNDGSTVATYTAMSDGDIVMIALDIDNGKIYWGRNGTWENSGDPTSGATGTGAQNLSEISTGYTYAFNLVCREGGTVHANYGNGYFGTTAVSSAQNPDDGIGIFEYSVPTGYRALCTKSINAEEYS